MWNTVIDVKWEGRRYASLWCPPLLMVRVRFDVLLLHLTTWTLCVKKKSSTGVQAQWHGTTDRPVCKLMWFWSDGYMPAVQIFSLWLMLELQVQAQADLKHFGTFCWAREQLKISQGHFICAVFQASRWYLIRASCLSTVLLSQQVFFSFSFFYLMLSD